MKIRTDFVTNSSSASYILEIALLSTAGKAYTCKIKAGGESEERVYEDVYLELKQSPEGPAVKGEDQQLHHLNNAGNIDELCALLLEAVETTSFEDEEPWSEEASDEDQEWDNSDNDRNQEAEEEPEEDQVSDESSTEVEALDPKSRFRATDRSNPNNIDEIKKVVVENITFGNGDTASWIDLNGVSEIRAFHEAYQQIGADRDAILNHLADYMTNGPVMAWQSNLNDASRPLPVFWKGVKAAEVEFYKEFLETPWSDADIWMVSPATIYEADLKADEFIERQILRLGLDYLPMEDRNNIQSVQCHTPSDQIK